MIPVLYNKNETQFRTFGLGELTDYASPPEVKRVRNGEYTLYMTYENDGVLADHLEEGMLIKSDAGRRTKWQTFEIVRVRRVTGKNIEVWANHISHRTLKDAIRPNVGVAQATAQEALRTWSNSLVSNERWTVQSDITTTGTTRWSIEEFQSARDVLGGVRGSILDVWGGEYEFDNRNIRLHREMGRKAATLLEYGRNITSLEQDRDETNVYTSVYPFARYTPEGSSDLEIRTMGGRLYVDGKYIDMHNHRKILVVDFSEEFEQDEEPTTERLKQLAERYAEGNEIGAPHENIKVNYIDLSQTLDYEDYQVMEEVELNDRVPIVYKPFDITNLNAKVVTITYQPTLNQNKEIELGVIGQRLGSAITSGIGGRLDRIESEQKRLSAPFTVNELGNKNWYETPDENMEHKIGDTWFEQNGPYTLLRVWNGNQWEVVINTEDVDRVAKEVERQTAKLNAFTEEIEAVRERNEEELDDFDKRLEDFRVRVDEFRNRIDDFGVELEGLRELDFEAFNAQLTELEDEIELLKEQGVKQEDIDEAIANAGFSRQEIRDIRRQLNETTYSSEMALEMIGSDGAVRYSKNRVDGETSGEIEFGGQPIHVAHNGEGFKVGQTYTISFSALCELLPQVGVDLRFNYPSMVERTLMVELEPEENLLDVIEGEAVSRFNSRVFKGFKYKLTVLNGWYKSIQKNIELEEDLVQSFDLVFRETVTGDVNSKRIFNWHDEEDLIVESSL